MNVLNLNRMPSLDILLEKNEEFAKLYQASPLMQLINSNTMEKQECRLQLLDSIQTLSNYFQKIVLLRSVLTDNIRYSLCALEHLKEEFCHNEQLMIERNHRPATWDPILEATCSWFMWKMFTSNDEEKVVLVHLILETSGSLFFNAAHQVMEKHMPLEYFKKHSEADEHHEKMGRELLNHLSPQHYTRLLDIQSQGWKIFMTASNRIAELSNQETI